MAVTSHPALLIPLGDTFKCGMNGRRKDSAPEANCLTTDPGAQRGPKALP